MNLLVWDPGRERAELLRGLLLARGDRVSVVGERGAARLRLETGLFDGIVRVEVRPGSPQGGIGAPFDLPAGVLSVRGGDLEWRAAPGEAPVRLPATVGGLSRAFERMRARVARAAASAEARVGGDGAWAQCRITGLSERAVLIEPAPGAAEAFARLAARIEAGPLATRFHVAGQEWPVRLRAIFTDRGPREAPAQIGAALEL